MNQTQKIARPSKEEQRIAIASHDTLNGILDGLDSDAPEILILESNEKIKVPIKTLKLLSQILKITGQGKPVSLVPIDTEMTTQAAADLLGCSRPYFVKLLESGKIDFIKIGRHRRVKFEDVMNYKIKRKQEQEALLIKMMAADEESGLYDS